MLYFDCLVKTKEGIFPSAKINSRSYLSYDKKTQKFQILDSSMFESVVDMDRSEKISIWGLADDGFKAKYNESFLKVIEIDNKKYIIKQNENDLKVTLFEMIDEDIIIPNSNIDLNTFISFSKISFFIVLISTILSISIIFYLFQFFQNPCFLMLIFGIFGLLIFSRCWFLYISSTSMKTGSWTLYILYLTNGIKTIKFNDWKINYIQGDSTIIFDYNDEYHKIYYDQYDYYYVSVDDIILRQVYLLEKNKK